MQSIEASKHYKNSIVCATRIVKDEGVLTLWSGAMPRLARLIMSGGIVFTMFVTNPNRTMNVANRWAGMRRLWKGWTSWIRSESICRISIHGISVHQKNNSAIYSLRLPCPRHPWPQLPYRLSKPAHCPSRYPNHHRHQEYHPDCGR